MNHAPTAGAWRLVAFLKNMRNVINNVSYDWRMAQKNVKNQSQKRALKILQIERKTEIKRWFLPLRVFVFRFFGGQSIAFRL